HREAPIEEVLRHRQAVLRVGGTAETSRPERPDPMLLHQPCDPMPSYRFALGRELLVHARATVFATTALVDRADLHHQLRIRPCSRRRLPLLEGVIATARDLEHPAQHRYRIAGLLRPDEDEPHLLSL